MDKKERDWLTIREFEICYPLEYLEFLETFEYENKICVLLDKNAMQKINLLIKTDEELKTQKFNNRIKQPTQTESIHTKKTQATIHENIFSNNFDNVNENKVYDYFKTELVDKKYLSETELIKYLDLAFDKKTIPKDKLSFIEFRTKQTITKIFYTYYKNISIGKQGEQSKYIRLLTDYFEGFEFETLKTNFNK